MTVVIAMKFNPEYVMGVADEEVSYASRTSNISTKIHDFADSYFIGGSGAVSTYEDVRLRSGNLKGVPMKEAANKISENVNDLALKYEDNIIESYGIGRAEFLTNKIGQEKLDDSIGNMIKRDLSERLKLYEGSFILAGIDKNEGAQIFDIPWRNLPVHEDKYAAIGTGSDRSLIVLTDYLEMLPPEKRDKIKPHEGCRLLMKAVRSAWGNAGVGGRTQVVWANAGEEKVHHLDSYRSNILQNVIFAYENNDIDNRYVNHIFRDVIEQDADKESLIKDLMKKMSYRSLAELYYIKGLHK